MFILQPAAFSIPRDVFTFRTLTTADGLSSNHVSAIYRDSKGFLWVGTHAGLNRYDAYQFSKFFSSKDGLPDNNILGIFEDYEGNVWIHCELGYSYYSYEEGRFCNSLQEKLASYSIRAEQVENMGTDRSRRYLWVYADRSISLYDSEKGSTQVIPLDSGSYLTDIFIADHTLYYIEGGSGRLYATELDTFITTEIAYPDIYKTSVANHQPQIFVDKQGGVWIYTFTNSELLHKSPIGHDWEEIMLPVNIKQFNRIAKIAEDSLGNIWLITSHHGAFVYRDGQLLQHSHDTSKMQSLPGDNLTDIYIDDDNIVWIGNNKLGLSYYIPGSQVFTSYRLGDNDDIQAFCENDDYLYLGTDGNGLIRYDKKSGKFQPVALDANVIVCLFNDSRNRLWVGTFQSGLACIDRGQVTYYQQENCSLADNNIYGIKEDDEGNIWIALLSGVVQKLNPTTGEFVTVFRGNRLNIRDLAYVGNHQMYAATTIGLLAINTQTEQYNFVTSNARQDIPLGKLYINTLHQDSKGILWMGTSDGLTYWNLKTDTIGHIGMEEGLPTDIITAVTEDQDGQIWVGSSDGLSRIRLSSTSYVINNYGKTNGLPSNDINQRALLCLKDGGIVMGTPIGFYVADPNGQSTTTFAPHVMLTRIDMEEGLQDGSPISVNHLELKRNQFPLRLYFSVFDYENPGDITYSYQIEDQEDRWIDMDGNYFDLTLLPVGTHKLKVGARNVFQVSSPNQVFTLKVLPPWYQSWQACLAYILIAVSVGYAVYRSWKKRKKHAAYLRSMEKETEERQRLMDAKLAFFANVSHELRTPLSLIINPLEEFLKRYPQYANSLLHTVKSNADYLHELIDQLLSFQKIDAGGETIRYSHLNVVRIVQDIFFIYQSMAEKKNINYQLFADPSVIEIDCDSGKVAKILRNLLSNAFKFTKAGGSINVRVGRHKDDQVFLTVEDTGTGIPAEERGKIFNKFYQSENNYAEGGSGIGLYLVEQYVKMHNGDITMSENLPHGCIFTVTLPLRAYAKAAVHNSPMAERSTDIQVNSLPAVQHSYTLLLVDDNREFLDFLSESLSTSYQILTATNGVAALDILHREEVDLVISDVMMSEMDGLQLCNKIKNDLTTSHIPVILLTARAGEEFQLEGLENGADDYITKPFSMSILTLRIAKLIESSLSKQRMFGEQVKVEPSKITITPLDQQFVEKAIKVVEDNLINENFSVEDLAAQLNISRGYLYRKLLKITGKTSLEFIRIIRMKRAQQMLAESQMQISEVAYKLGYSSPKTFTKHFKKEFGISPSEYLKSFRKE